MIKIDYKDPKSYKEGLEEEIGKMVIPTPSKKIKFSWMQKLFAYWVKEKHYYGNWSGTGVGKTYSFILASRMIDSHLTVVIGKNSNTNQLAGEIIKLYNDSVAIVYDGKLPDFDMTKHNYLIFNYEKGQQEYSEKVFDSVLDKYKVDYIVFDEVQLVKQRDKKCSTRRKNFQTFRNNAVERYDSYVSVLTATPYTNNIFEVISILSLLTGESYKDIKKRNILQNTCAVENLLNSHGVLAKTAPKNAAGKVIEENIQIEEIIGDTDTFNSFKKSINMSALSVYQSVLKDKLEYIYMEDKVKKGDLTILYTHYVKGIVDQSKTFFTDLGYKVCEFTGENNDTKLYTDKYGGVDWEKVGANFDIIIASDPIATGVDGLQEVCNNMVILSLPWTDADFTQLKGRIARKNSIFDKVNICIPMVRFSEISMTGYDDKVWNTIQTKGEFSNACLYGEFPKDVKSIHRSVVKELKGLMSDDHVYAA